MSKTTSKSVTPIKSSDVARVQRAVARQHEGQVPKGSYVGRMPRTVAVAPPVKKTGK